MKYVKPDIELAAALDEQLQETDLFDALDPGEEGWIRRVRLALGLSTNAIAEAVGVTQQAVAQLEQREIVDSISLERLRTIADALDCDLVYGFIPRESLEDRSRMNADYQV